MKLAVKFQFNRAVRNLRKIDLMKLEFLLLFIKILILFYEKTVLSNNKLDMHSGPLLKYYYENFFCFYIINNKWQDFLL